MKKTLLIATKILLATLSSIVIAKTLGLMNPLSAGIIAILSVLSTKKLSIDMAFKRVVSTVLALVVATTIFYFVGFNLMAFAFYLFVYGFLVYSFKIEVGITPSTVLVTHLLTAQNISFMFLLNEMGLMLIGSIMAIIFNIYTLNNIKELKILQNEVEEIIKRILYTFEIKLVDPTYEKTLYEDLDKLLKLCKEGVKLAQEDIDNSLLDSDDYYFRYFKMRKRQQYILVKIAKDLKFIDEPIIEAQKIAEVIHVIAFQLNKSNDCVDLIKKSNELYKYYSCSKLPKNRNEFEKRAVLFQLLNELSQFLQYKNEFILDGRK